jgi:broad specificity phosphatase PhoE
MDLFLVRHGQTVWSAEGRYTSSTDLELTAHGRTEARQAAVVLRAMAGSQLEFDSIWISPLRRTVETATLMFGRGTKAVTCSLLREVHFGDFEGMTLRESERSRPGWDIWQNGGPNGETASELAARAERFLNNCLDRSQRTVIIAHGYILRMIATRAMGLSPAVGRHLMLDTGSVSLVADRRGRRGIIHWNVTSSLAG